MTISPDCDKTDEQWSTRRLGTWVALVGQTGRSVTESNNELRGRDETPTLQVSVTMCGDAIVNELERQSVIDEDFKKKGYGVDRARLLEAPLEAAFTASTVARRSRVLRYGLEMLFCRAGAGRHHSLGAVSTTSDCRRLHQPLLSKRYARQVQRHSSGSHRVSWDITCSGGKGFVVP